MGPWAHQALPLSDPQPPHLGNFPELYAQPRARGHEQNKVPALRELTFSFFTSPTRHNPHSGCLSHTCLHHRQLSQLTPQPPAKDTEYRKDSEPLVPESTSWAESLHLNPRNSPLPLHCLADPWEVTGPFLARFQRPHGTLVLGPGSSLPLLTLQNQESGCLPWSYSTSLALRDYRKEREQPGKPINTKVP